MNLDDNSLLSKIIGVLVAVIGALTGWAWTSTHKRIDKMEERTEDKASNSEVNRQRDHIALLFEKISELGDKTEVRFSRVEQQAADRHVELLNAIHANLSAIKKR